MTTIDYLSSEAMNKDIKALSLSFFLNKPLSVGPKFEIKKEKNKNDQPNKHGNPGKGVDSLTGWTSDPSF
jgi:hypothetical protein